MTKPLRTWWHELNTWEPDTARAFYGRTLGWEFEKVALLPMPPSTGSRARKASRWVAFSPSASRTMRASLHIG